MEKLLTRHEQVMIEMWTCHDQRTKLFNFLTFPDDEWVYVEHKYFYTREEVLENLIINNEQTVNKY